MKTSFIEIDKIKIAYIEKNADAANTIFFIHGNSVSKSSWRKQFKNDLFSDYRLIALDLPGHGDSDKAVSNYEVYSLRGLASIMQKAVEQLNNQQPYILAALSVGTNVVAEMLNFNVTPKGLIFAGPSLVGRDYAVEEFVKPNTHVHVVFSKKALPDQVALYGKEASLSLDEVDQKTFTGDYENTDGELRIVFGTSIAEKKYSDEIQLVIQKEIPCLVVFGLDEKVINPNYLDDANLPLWKNTIFKIPGASHLVNIDQPEAFNKLAADFVKEVFR